MHDPTHRASKELKDSSARPSFATGRRRRGRLVVVPAQIAVIAQFPGSESAWMLFNAVTLHERGRDNKRAPE